MMSVVLVGRWPLFGVAWVCLVSLLGSGIDGAARDPCGRVLFTGSTGFIRSHTNFGRRMYPRDQHCTWRILAPPYQRILIFPSFMSLEYEEHCGHDRVEIFNGVNTSNAANSLGSVCGADTDVMFVSSGSHMSIHFHSDFTINKEGFSLRYSFVDFNFIPTNASRYSRGGRPCTMFEQQCGNGLCIPWHTMCDRYDDCGDQSDEQHCVINVPHPCPGNSFFYCSKSDTCIPYHMKCDGVRDCPQLEDEESCDDGMNVDRNVSTPFDPTVWPTLPCGVPAIQPIENQTQEGGGQLAEPYSWPWTVSVRLNKSHVCGGSIIAKKWVLTAAHCVDGYLNPVQWDVAAGIISPYSSDNERMQILKVSRIIVHRKWNSDLIDFDLALLNLNYNFQWTTYVRPVCLPDSNITGSKCYIAGWGSIEGIGGFGQLKQGHVQTFSHAQCDEWYGGGITKNMICAGRREGGVDSCQGDSGGPLVCKSGNAWVLHGVTSFGGVCGAAQSPGVYAKVSAMRSWIAENVG